VAELEAENAQLRGKSGGTPSWVKANRPPREKQPPKRRHQACVRRRETPDEIQEHAVETCPDCGHKLAHGWVHSSRQVIELLPPQVRVVEHRFIRRRCGVCGKRWLPKVGDVSLGVAGQRRFGAGIQSLVTLLRVAYRLPVAMIRRHAGGTLRAPNQRRPDRRADRRGRDGGSACRAGNSPGDPGQPGSVLR